MSFKSQNIIKIMQIMKKKHAFCSVCGRDNRYVSGSVYSNIYDLMFCDLECFKMYAKKKEKDVEDNKSIAEKNVRS